MLADFSPKERVFLFLQGPHGPFFRDLARQLEAAGAGTWRVGFNAGDAAYWTPRSRFIPFRAAVADWPEALDTILRQRGVTDLVLYGDTRPVHASAVKAAQAQGLNLHVFEEGYLRPYWITYELGGANGHSRLMHLSIDDMRRCLDGQAYDPPVPPAHWGDIRQHMFYGAAYHWYVLAMNHSFPDFEPHRALSVSTEFHLHLRRMLLMPWHGLERRLATRRIRKGTFPFHLALLQLEHDSAFQDHSPFSTQSEFLTCVMEGFAQGAPAHHHLVFKAHPLEDGRTPLRADIHRLAKRNGIAERVHFLRGGKLAYLLDAARSATTVNSTAAQQALWRGLPVRAFGDAVYAKPQLVSNQPLATFFADPDLPDIRAYHTFRDFLLATSQRAGSFYAKTGRRQLLRNLPDLMLSARDPYAFSTSKNAADTQQFRIVD